MSDFIPVVEEGGVHKKDANPFLRGGVLRPLVSDFHGKIHVTGGMRREEDVEEDDEMEELEEPKNLKKRSREEKQKEEKREDAQPFLREIVPPFYLRIILYTALVFSSLFFLSIIVVAVNHRASFLDATLHLMHFRQLPPAPSEFPIYSVWARAPQEAVAPLDLRVNYARHLIAALVPSFQHYLTAYPCLCMHHFNLSNTVPLQVCAVPGPLILVNPAIVGYSKKEDATAALMDTEQQMSILEWTDFNSERRFYGILALDTMRCMERAILEFQGEGPHE